MAEKTITIRVDEDMYKKIKVKVATQGITLKEYILKLIKEDMDSEKHN
jgi:predicted DNA binding CopG/RHH family protein